MATSQKIVVYSCVTGNRDSIKSIAYNDNFRYVMFTDADVDENTGWEVVKINYKNPIVTARYYKHHPQEFFPEAEISIWIDGTHWPYASLVPLIDCLENNDIAASKHFCRSTIKEEAEVCLKNKMDDSNKILSQIEKYKLEGFIDNLGLYETSYLVRKHTKSLLEFQKLWWSEIKNYSCRDQISMMYCLWKLNMKISTIPGQCREGINYFFKMRPHRKNAKLILI